MKKSFCLNLLLILLSLPSLGQTAAPRFRISLLTVSTGDEIYASFGHTGIRVLDSVSGRDIVYNWGTFDGFQENFELKFMRGKLEYYCSSETFQHFYQTYVHEQRGVQEQEIYLNPQQKLQLVSFLDNNLSEENRYYKYDFLYDNCATRPRDVFHKTFGPNFKFGQALPPNSQITFRDIINHYLAHLHWERFGINLLLGSGVDKVMSNEDAMFLPDYLRDGLAGATVNSIQASAQPTSLLTAPPPPKPSSDGPLLLTLIIAALVIIGSVIPGFQIIGQVSSNILLIVTGLLGCLMLFMWIGTDHQACRDNWNLLWALPTNLIVPFIKSHKRSRYALVAMILIGVSLLLHILRIQALPLYELWPVLVALLAVFGMIYRHATVPASHEVEAHHHH